jgi:ABC-type multidrug transport system fused ATPase/permease subunit
MCSRNTRFLAESDYFYILKGGKIVEEGDRSKIGEKFEGITTVVDKVNVIQSLNQSSHSLINNVRGPLPPAAAEEPAKRPFPPTSELYGSLSDAASFLIVTLILYMALLCGFTKIIMFRTFTVILYQMGDSTDTQLIQQYALIFATAFLTFPIYEYLTQNLFSKNISSMFHSKLIYRMLHTTSNNVLGYSTLSLQTSKMISNLDDFETYFPQTAVTMLYQLSFLVAITVLLIVLTNFTSVALLLSIGLIAFNLRHWIKLRYTFREMETFIYMKWFGLNLDIFKGTSIIRANNYSLFFQMKLFFLEERRNMISLYLAGSKYRESLKCNLLFVLTALAPLLAVAFFKITPKTHIPCISMGYLFIFYAPMLAEKFVEALVTMNDHVATLSETLHQTRIGYRQSDKVKPREVVVGLSTRGCEESVLAFQDVLIGVDAGTPEECVSSSCNFIEQFSLNIKLNQKVAIVYDKITRVSIISKIVLKMFDIYTGKVTMFNHDIRDINPQALRKNIFYLDFETGLMKGTLGENIHPNKSKYIDSKSTVEIIGLLENFGFFSKEFFEQKLDMRVDPDLMTSHDKIIIGLVRCLVERKPVVILDNIDSRFNIEVYSKFKRIIETTLQGTTVLMICSVPKVAHLMDTCLVFKGHRLVEQGAPSELEKDQGSVYSQLLREDMLDI